MKNTLQWQTHEWTNSHSASWDRNIGSALGIIGSVTGNAYVMGAAAHFQINSAFYNGASLSDANTIGVISFLSSYGGSELGEWASGAAGVTSDAGQAIISGAMSGALSGSLNAAYNGENVARGMVRGAARGAATAMVMTAIQSAVKSLMQPSGANQARTSGDAIPEGIKHSAEDSGLGLEWEGDKLTGDIQWGCEGSQCQDVIDHFNDLSGQNESLDIRNSLAVNKDSIDARIRFYSNKSSDIGGFWDGQGKTLWYNTASGVSARISKHEFGHAIGLGHMANDSKNFMSYYGTSSFKPDVSYQLTGNQQYCLDQAYTPWYQNVLGF